MQVASERDTLVRSGSSFSTERAGCVRPPTGYGQARRRVRPRPPPLLPAQPVTNLGQARIITKQVQRDRTKALLTFADA